jgi:hypothetical protein
VRRSLVSALAIDRALDTGTSATRTKATSNERETMKTRLAWRAGSACTCVVATALAATAEAGEPGSIDTSYGAVTIHVAPDTVFALAAGKLGRARKHDSLAVLVNPSDVVLVQGPEWRAQTIHTSDDAIGDRCLGSEPLTKGRACGEALKRSRREFRYCRNLSSVGHAPEMAANR